MLHAGYILGPALFLVINPFAAAQNCECKVGNATVAVECDAIMLFAGMNATGWALLSKA